MIRPYYGHRAALVCQYCGPDAALVGVVAGLSVLPGGWVSAGRRKGVLGGVGGDRVWGTRWRDCLVVVRDGRWSDVSVVRGHGPRRPVRALIIR